jgi:hypothetical protein
LTYTDTDPVYAEPVSAWCTKQVTLTLSGDDLSGTWSTPGCNSGTIHLHRPPPIVDTNTLRLLQYPSPVGQTFTFVKVGNVTWKIMPAPIGDADLAGLQPGAEQDGSFVIGQPGPARIAMLPSGKLYLLQGSGAWPLVAQQTDDAEMAAIDAGTEWRNDITDGNLPDAFLLSGDGGAPAPAPSGTDAAPPMRDTSPEAPPDTDESGRPDVLTDSSRNDIVAAVQRANAAWATATQTLDASGLSAGVAGAELANDIAELSSLRAQNHRKTNLNTAFTVNDITLDAPGRATVYTLETWYMEIYDLSTGRLLERTPPATYTETYAVEFVNGGWIVTLNQLNQ